MKILFVDDDPIQLKIITKSFKKLGHDAIGVSSGICALDIIPKFNPDIVISDGEMPKMNGIELAFNLKDYKFPVYILTSSLTILRKSEGKYFIKNSMLKPASIDFISHTIGLINRDTLK